MLVFEYIIIYQFLFFATTRICTFKYLFSLDIMNFQWWISEDATIVIQQKSLIIIIIFSIFCFPM